MLDKRQRRFPVCRQFWLFLRPIITRGWSMAARKSSVPSNSFIPGSKCTPDTAIDRKRGESRARRRAQNRKAHGYYPKPLTAVRLLKITRTTRTSPRSVLRVPECGRKNHPKPTCPPCTMRSGAVSVGVRARMRDGQLAYARNRPARTRLISTPKFTRKTAGHIRASSAGMLYQRWEPKKFGWKHKFEPRSMRDGKINWSAGDGDDSRSLERISTTRLQLKLRCVPTVPAYVASATSVLWTEHTVITLIAAEYCGLARQAGRIPSLAIRKFPRPVQGGSFTTSERRRSGLQISQKHQSKAMDWRTKTPIHLRFKMRKSKRQ